LGRQRLQGFNFQQYHACSRHRHAALVRDPVPHHPHDSSRAIHDDRHPIAGAAGHFPIDHGNPRKIATSLRRVIEGVKAGRSLAVFPEGRRTDDGQLQAFEPGAFKIALRAGVPIVPVTIRGTFKMLPRTSLAPRPGRVDVIISEPIETTDYNEKTLPALIERTRAAIAANL